jgi:tryptophan synthase alpha chain
VNNQPAHHLSRIGATLARHHEAGTMALVGWQTIGFPTVEASRTLVPALIDGGFDLIELGVPFSDPQADGTTIQRASFEALKQGATLSIALDTVRTLRSDGITAPLIFMSYYNPILSRGLERFAIDASEAGVDGLIVPDLPAEESDDLIEALDRVGIDTIFLVAPTTPEQRLRAIAARARGFIYCVSLTGVTGARQALPTDLPEYLARVRSFTDLPLAVGFGVSRPEHVASLRGIADAAIVASAIIDRMEHTPPDTHVHELRSFAKSLRNAADGVS